MKPLLSVIVCTRNRVEDLGRCLDSLEAQTRRDLLEVVLVDNGSTDGTPELLRRRLQSSGGSWLTVLTEPRPGLSVARNAALRKARGTWVVFPDDDAEAPLDYAAELAEGAEEHGATHGLLGFRLRDVLDQGLPPWMPPDFLARPYPEAPGELDLGRAWGWLNSQDVMIRRDLVLEAGGFDPHLGMRGGRVLVGEESALIRRLGERGVRAFWMGRPEVLHHLRPDRATRLHWWRRAVASGRFSAPEHWRAPNRRTLRALRETMALARETGGLGWGILSRRLTPQESFLGVRKLCKRWGRLSAFPRAIRRRDAP